VFSPTRWMKRHSASTRIADRHPRAFRPFLEALEDRQLLATNLLVVGVDVGPPHVKVFNNQLQEVASFFAYAPSFAKGVRVATGDVNNDGVEDIITGAGQGGNTHVKVIDGTRLNQVQPNGQIADSALLASFLTFAPFQGDIFVGSGDVNKDGFGDVVVGAGPGAGPQVKVIDGTRLNRVQASGQIADSALLASFFAFDPAYRGGVTVAVGDNSGDGVPDIIVGSRSSSSHVKIIDGTKLNQVQANGQIADSALLLSALAFKTVDPLFNSGVLVAAADIDGDGRTEMIVGKSAPGDGSVGVFKTPTTTTNALEHQLIYHFRAFGTGYDGGVRVAGSDLTGDGSAEVISAPNLITDATGNGTSTGGNINIVSYGTQIATFMPFGASFTGGLFIG